MKDPYFLNAGEGSVAAVVLGHELINELIKVCECEFSIAELLTNLAVVVVERLEVLVNVGDGACEAQVERPKNSDILVVLVLDELEDNFLVGLDLEHLEGEAEEGGRPAVAVVGAAGVVELHGLVDEGLRQATEELYLFF